MATRYKKVYYDTDYLDQDIYTSVPIQEWRIQPTNINFNHTLGHVPPVGYSSQILFPELWEWIQRQHDQVHFAIELTHSGNYSWVEVQGFQFSGTEFTQNNILSSELAYIFSGINHLPVGTHSATIRLKAFWDKPTGKEFIEYCPISINIVVHIQDANSGSSSGGNYLPPLHMIYDKHTGTIMGDSVFTVDNTGYDSTAVYNDPSYFVIQHQGISTFKINSNTHTQNLTLGIHQGLIVIEKRKLQGNDTLVTVPYVLEVIDTHGTDFLASPKNFSFRASRNISKTYTSNIQLANPNNLAIQVESYPHFISSVSLSGQELTFHTINSSSLPVGNYEGNIVLKSGAIRKHIKVQLDVFQNFQSEFIAEPYYFALDQRKIIVEPSRVDASYIIMELDMAFQGYGEYHREKQSYHYPFFGGKTTIYPGEEVQDFFIKTKNLIGVSICDYQYHLAVVNITFKEYDAMDNEITSFQIPNIFFAPGKKPKCFPVFTDYPIRRTFNNSRIRLNADIISDKFGELFQKYSSPTPALSNRAEVYAFNFHRHLFDTSEEKNTLTTEGITFVPFPHTEQDKIIHLFFENQNLVLEWFSCPIEHQRRFEFTHITNEQTGEKYITTETENLILNTGWILKEEIELINALIKSRICFIVIENTVIKAKATNKNNEMYDTAKNLYSMDIEFNIKKNER